MRIFGLSSKSWKIQAKTIKKCKQSKKWYKKQHTLGLVLAWQFFCELKQKKIFWIFVNWYYQTIQCPISKPIFEISQNECLAKITIPLRLFRIGPLYASPLSWFLHIEWFTKVLLFFNLLINISLTCLVLRPWSSKDQLHPWKSWARQFAS